MHPYVNIATKAARSAGRLIAQYADRIDRIDVEIKSGPNDLVTSVDKAAEEMIMVEIRKAYPDHGMLGEESGEVLGTNMAEVVWIIDPLDGTLNYVHGFPYFCVSIGIQMRGVMEHAVIYNPMNNELFTATKGEGAQLDGRKIRVSNNNLESSIISPGLGYKRINEPLDTCMQRVQRVTEQAAGIRRGGAAALELANIAAGRLDGFWEMGLGPWDMAAGSLLVREAGGFVGDLDGNDTFMESGKIVAGNPKVYPELIKLM